jgi:hypothetical protein
MVSDVLRHNDKHILPDARLAVSPDQQSAIRGK